MQDTYVGYHYIRNVAELIECKCSVCSQGLRAWEPFCIFVICLSTSADPSVGSAIQLSLSLSLVVKRMELQQEDDAVRDVCSVTCQSIVTCFVYIGNKRHSTGLFGAGKCPSPAPTKFCLREASRMSYPFKSWSDQGRTRQTLTFMWLILSFWNIFSITI